MQRLGKNIGRYFGETIDIQQVLSDTEAAAKEHGWSSETFLETQELKLLALTRAAKSAFTHHVLRVYISTGIHGDEPAGPLAVHRLLQENKWPEEMALWICPCLNPAGFALNRRENAEGLDLNRQYLQAKAEETIAHVAWLGRQPKFDLTLVLHEDWEAHGFYVYELNPDNQPSLAEAIVKRVADVCPIDTSEVIEGRLAQGGIIRPGIDPRTRPQWPESFYLMTHKTRLSYTLEAPSDFPLQTRVDALVAGVNAAAESLVVDKRG